MIHAIRDGREVIHWPETIKELIALKKKHGASEWMEAAEDFDPEYFDGNEYEFALGKAMTAASDWPLCACGSLCRAVPRLTFEESCKMPYVPDEHSGTRAHGAPKDRELARLGIGFMRAIEKQDFEDAIFIQARIENRTITILEEMGLAPQPYEAPRKS